VYFQKRDRLERAANGVIALCSLCALSGIVQHVLSDRWMRLSPGFMQASLHYASFPSAAAKAAGISGASYRMYGSLVDPASLGEACAFGILVAVAALTRLRGPSRVFAALAIPLMAVGVELSQARASIAGLVVGLIVLTALLGIRREVRAVAFIGLIAVATAVPVGVALTGGRLADRVLSADSVAYASQSRDETREQTLYELPRFPFGHGLGSTGGGGNLRDGTGFAVDNVYFSTLYETGIVGVGVFLAFQCAMLYYGLRAMRRAKTIGAYTVFAGILSTQILMLVNGWFSQGAFDYAPVAQFFWFFSGAVARSDAWA
jgi:O-antigen ligase